VKNGGSTYGISSGEKKHRKLQDVYSIEYPLREWGWDRDECKRQITAAGLPVPVKSACFCCPASKKPELYELDLEQLKTAVHIENTYRSGKHFRPDSTVIGLGRKFQWAPYLAERLDDACQSPAIETDDIPEELQLNLF
jgi:hypothetical protein